MIIQNEVINIQIQWIFFHINSMYELWQDLQGKTRPFNYCKVAWSVSLYILTSCEVNTYDWIFRPFPEGNNLWSVNLIKVFFMRVVNFEPDPYQQR